jgi:hypothetical protein
MIRLPGGSMRSPHGPISDKLRKRTRQILISMKLIIKERVFVAAPTKHRKGVRHKWAE